MKTSQPNRLWLVVSAFLLTSFTALGQAYSRAELPPLLEFLDGRKVAAVDHWEERREEIRSLLIKYFIGSFPAETPKIAAAKVISEKVHDDGSTPATNSRHVGYPESCRLRDGTLVA